LEPQQEDSKEELATDSMMESSLGLVEKRGVLRAEKIFGTISSHGEEPGHGSSE
jgi:hypothetical protein